VQLHVLACWFISSTCFVSYNTVLYYQLEITPNLSLSVIFSSGTVCIMQLNIDRRERPEILRTVLEHKGSVVTSLCWSNNGKNLYIGDEQGVVNGVRSAVTKVVTLQFCVLCV
jgi:hypothetical protein